MHRGREYPYHPQFWNGWTYFWPGYLPWKMALNFGVFGVGYASNIITPPGALISAAGTALSPSHMRYGWSVSYSPLFDFLELDLVDITFSGVRYTQWQMSMFLLGVPMNDSYRSIRSPTYQVYEIGTFWWLTPDEFPTVQNGYFELQPAAYSQGGSPWP